MKIRKSGFAAAVAVVATTALLAVSLPAQAANPTVTIWGDKDTKAAVMPSLTKFGKSAKITINWVEKDFGQLRAAAITAIPTGSGPDIIAGAHDWTGKLLGAGVIAPVNLGANAKKFSAEALSGFSVYGKVYGVPGWTENIALVYNKTKVSTPAKTGAEFAQAIKDGKVEVGFGATTGDPYHFSVFATSFGLSQYNRVNGTWSNQIGYGGANGAKYAEWLASADGGKALNSGNNGDWSTLQGQLKDPNSKVAYWVTGPWAVNGLTTEETSYGKPAVKVAPIAAKDLGVTVFPSIGGKTVHQFSGVRGYWQSVKVPGSKKAVVVGKVLNFLASSASQSAVYKLKKLIPANQDALKTVKDPILLGFGKAGKAAYPMASFVFQDTTWSTLGKAEAALISGNTAGKSASQFFQDAVTALQAIIDAS